MPPITEIEPDSGLNSSDIVDVDLSRLLSRLASLQGHAVPVHRFTMRSVSVDGIPLAELSRQQRALEQWTACFPGSENDVITDAASSDLPALWVSEDGEEICLLRGRLSSGAYISETVEGKSSELSVSHASIGKILVLRVDDGLEETPGAPPRTAEQWFVHALQKRRRIFVEGALATFTLNLVGLATSLYTMQVYDRVVPNQGYATLWVLTVGVLIGIVFELAMKQVRSRMIDLSCKAIDEELSGVFFGQALSIRMDARPRTVGTFASQIRNFESVRNFMTSSTLFIFADAPFAIVFIGIIALLAGPVALVPLFMIPVAVATGFFFRKPLKAATEKHIAESNRKNGVLIEAIDGIESVKAAGAEWKMLDQWRALTAKIAKNELHIRSLSTLGTNMTQTVQQISYVGLVAAGAYAIGQGSLTMGGLIACTIISGRALTPIAQLSSMIVQWESARVSLVALDAIMALPRDREHDRRLLVPEICEGRLRLDGVKFSYGTNPVLVIDRLAINTGERIGILGAVGSGKSTLLKLLSGLFHPGEGRVMLDDVDMTHLAPEFVREHIGYLPQDVRLFSGTLRENLALGLPSPSDSQVLAATRITGLDRVIESHPQGLGLEITEGGRGLSGGQRQLVGLTRLALAQPKVVLLDEPTASMDGNLEAYVTQRMFEQMPKDHTLVVVTHKLGLLKHFSRLIVIERGQIMLDGPRDEVLERLRQGSQPAQQAKPVEATAAKNTIVPT